MCTHTHTSKIVHKLLSSALAHAPGMLQRLDLDVRQVGADVVCHRVFVEVVLRRTVIIACIVIVR